MAKLIAARSAQTVLSAEVTFNFDDTAETTTGTTVDFGKVNTASSAFDFIPLPAGATVIGGEVETLAVFDAATYNISVGDATSAARYLGATDRKAVGRTPLVPTGFVSTGEKVRVTVVPADACTTGKATVRIMYTIKDRTSEIYL